MCCMVAPEVESIYAVWWHKEWNQYVLYGGTRSGSNMCCMVAPGVEAICAVWWHQEWKQYVTGVTTACFHSLRIVPVNNEKLKIVVKGNESSLAATLSDLAMIPSVL